MKKRHSRKHLIPVVLLGLLCAVGTFSAAQDVKPFIGDWAGSISVGPQEIEIVCHFKLDDSGNLTGTIDVTTQGATGLKLGDFKVEGKKISFSIDDPGVPGDARFEGTLDETGTMISGDFSQGGATGSFELKKE